MKEFMYDKQVERWGILEVRVPGKIEGNPFTDYHIQTVFTAPNETKTVNGFYDGNGEYVVRFLLDFESRYSFEVNGSFSNKISMRTSE